MVVNYRSNTSTKGCCQGGKGSTNKLLRELNNEYQEDLILSCIVCGGMETAHSSISSS